MKQLRFGLLLGGLALAGASSLQAQNTIALTAPYAPGGGAVTAFGYYMSPYSGTVNGATVRLNCVDFFHDVYVGEVWSANITNLGKAADDLTLLASTRDGSTGGYSSLSYVLKLYEQAAWLTDQYGLNPGANPDRSIAIQTAIWAIVDNGPTLPASLKYANTQDYWSNGAQSTSIVNTGVGSTGYWIDRAQTQYALQSDTYYDKFNIITGSGVVGSGAQEFIYSTPEPGTFVLIGSGLVGIAGFERRRRRKAAEQLVVVEASQG